MTGTFLIVLLVLSIASLSIAGLFYRKWVLTRNTEGELDQSRRSYQTLAESSPVGIFHTDAKGYTTYVNPRWCEITGMTAAQGLGNGWLEAVHPDDRRALAEEWDRATRAHGGSVYVYRFVRQDGSIVWVQGEAVPELNARGEVVGYVGTATDITGGKLAEQEISKLHREMETVLNRIKDAMVAVDSNWRYTYLNDQALSLHPQGREWSLGKTIWEIHPALTGTIFWTKYHEAMELRKTIAFESQYPPTGAWFAIKVYPSADGLTIFYTDITDKKQAELLLRENEERYLREQITARETILNERNLSDTIINSMPGIFYLLTQQGQNLRWNHNFEKVTEYGPEEIRGLHPQDLFEGEEKELISKAMENVFVFGEDQVQASLRTKSGKLIPYYLTGKSIEYEGQPCLLGVGIDFTERVQAQERIKDSGNQLRKLAAHLQNIREQERGEIARDIHDDLGQLLTAIKIDLSRLAKKLDASPALASQVREVIGMIGTGIESIRRISRQLRPSMLDDLGLEEAMKWQIDDFEKRYAIKVVAQFTNVPASFEPSVATNLFRIFQETLTNIARHAEASTVTIRLGMADGTVSLSIEDDGRGLDADKIKGKRTLGILGMQERAIMIGGRFEIEGQPQQGTTIRVVVPAGAGAASEIDADH